MNKKICVLLSVLLLTSLLLSGCGAKEPEESIIEPAATEAPTVEPSSETSPEPAPATETPAEDDSATEGERVLDIGQFSGSTYTNNYAGFGCTLDGSWVFADAQQLQNITDVSLDLMEEADLEDYFDTEGLTSITDMYAENSEMMSTVNVMYTKMELAERLSYLTMDEEAVIDTVLSQSDYLVSLYESMGATVISMEKVQVNFLGEEHYAVKTVTDSQGITAYTLQFSDPFKGAYSITTTIISYGEDNTQAVADLFFPVEE